jgi:hypothetical protein
MHIHVCVSLHAYTHGTPHRHTPAHVIHTCVDTHVHTYMHFHIHVCTHPETHTCTFTHMLVHTNMHVSASAHTHLPTIGQVGRGENEETREMFKKTKTDTLHEDVAKSNEKPTWWAEHWPYSVHLPRQP